MTTTPDYLTHPEFIALMRRILETPEDDAPRGVIADWIRQEGNDDARADFIEVQMELARIPEPLHAKEQHDTSESPSHWCPYCRWEEQTYVKRRREADLFERFAVQWFDTPGMDSIRLRPYREELGPAPYGVVRRGMLSEVRLPTAAFLGGPCGRCEGRGYLYGDGTSRPACETCGGQNVRLDGERRFLPHKQGSGTLPGLAKRLFTDHPVTRVVLTDKRPERIGGGRGFGWDFEMAGTPSRPHDIPLELWRLLLPYRTDEEIDEHGWYDSEADANAALSAAAVRFGRRLAGLPPLGRAAAAGR